MQDLEVLTCLNRFGWESSSVRTAIPPFASNLIIILATHAICTTSALFPSSGQSPMMGLFFLLTQFTNTYKDLFIMPAVTPVIAQAPSQTPT